MPKTKFVINGRKAEVDADVDTPLLWIIREQLKLTGTKFGCGIAQCGACTVHVEGNAVRSCQISLGDIEEKNVTTIEGLSTNADHPLQIAYGQRASRSSTAWTGISAAAGRIHGLSGPLSAR